MVASRRSHRRATSAMAWVAWSSRSASTRKRTSRPCLPPVDQPGVLEHDEVLGDGLAGEGDLVGQRAGGRLTPLDEEIEHATTGGVGDRRPQVVVGLGPHRRCS